MELNSRISALEQEVNLLKTEIKQVLVDLRDAILEHENPFSASTMPASLLAGAPPKERDGEPAAGPAPPPEETGEPRHGTALSAASPSSMVPLGGAAYAPTPAPPVTANGSLGWSVVTTASLVKWVESALRQVGRERFETIIEIYDLASGGRSLAPEARAALLKMTKLSDLGEERPAATMNDCIALLAQLDAILRSSGPSETTVLSLLTDLNLH